MRCGECAGCLADNCGLCKFCLDKPKFGGPEKKKRLCVQQKYTKLESHIKIPPIHQERNIV